MRAVIALLLCLSLSGVAYADDGDTGLKIHSMPIAHRNPRQKAAAIGLLIGSGVCLALGGVFTALAKQANDKATVDMTYHPDQEGKRTDYQIADGFLYGVGVAALTSGVILLW